MTEPGWPIPGEVDVPWSAPAAEPVGAGSASWSEQAATSAPPADLQWAPPEQAAEEIPQWSPAPEPLAEEIPQWTPPAEPVQQAAPVAEAPAQVQEAPEAPMWEAADEDVEAAWVTDEPYHDDAQATGEIPVIRVEDTPPAPVPAAEYVMPDDPFAEVAPEPEAVAVTEAPVEEPPFVADSLELEYPEFEDDVAFDELAGPPAEFIDETPVAFTQEEPVEIAPEPVAEYAPEQLDDFGPDAAEPVTVGMRPPLPSPRCTRSSRLPSRSRRPRPTIRRAPVASRSAVSPSSPASRPSEA